MIASDTRRRLVAIISIGVALLVGCGAALAVTGGSGHGSAPAAFPGSRTAIHARTVTFPASDGTTVTGLIRHLLAARRRRSQAVRQRAVLRPPPFQRATERP